MADKLASQLKRPLCDLLLSIADDKFFLGHRNGDWTGLAPFLEEDIAFSNIAQDEIAHAQELYKLVAALTAAPEDLVAESNRLAYARPSVERLNAALVELPDEFDWAVAVARQCFYDHFDLVRLPRLQRSSHVALAQLSGKMLQEVTFHVDHFDNWIHKLGKGTSESKDKLQAATERLWPYALGLFEPVEGQQQLSDAGLYPGDDDGMKETWLKSVGDLLVAAQIQVPVDCSPANVGSRQGQHTKELQPLLEELSEVYSCEPGSFMVTSRGY